MSTKVVGAGTLKEGSYILIDGAPCRISSTDTSKSGKHGHAKVRIVAIGLLDEKKREVVMPAHDNVEVPLIDKNTAQVLSVTGDMANVMDETSFETFDLKIPEEMKEQVVPNCKILYWVIMGEKVMKQLKQGADE